MVNTSVISNLLVYQGVGRAACAAREHEVYPEKMTHMLDP
jgi:hypothetical protein